jgi:hypothetical protein
MFFPGALPLFSVCVHRSYRTMYVDFKASREESEVPLRGYECRSTSNTAAQAKEEGRQDGLRLPWPGSGGTTSLWQGYLHLSLPHLYRLSPFCSIPSFLSFTVWCCDYALDGYPGGNICRDRAAALVGAEDVWTQMTYGRRMAAACTMTVMRRGPWKRGRRGDVHIKVSKAYAWTAPFSCITTPPRLASFHSPTNLIIYFPY